MLFRDIVQILTVFFNNIVLSSYNYIIVERSTYSPVCSLRHFIFEFTQKYLTLLPAFEQFPIHTS